MKKKIFAFFFLCICVEYGFIPPIFVSENKPLIIAHRGASAHAPENTLPAFDLAIRHNADAIEVDVRRTKDQIPVALHDASLLRVTGADCLVADITFRQLSRLSIRSDNSSHASAVSLENVLNFCKNKVPLHLDLKIPGSEQQIVSLIQKYDLSGQCRIISSDPSVLQHIKELDPQITTVLLIPSFHSLSICLCETLCYRAPQPADDIDCYSVKSRLLTASFVRIMHKNRKQIYAWTVNSKAELIRMKRLGVDAVITDDPQKANRTLSYAP